MKTILWKICGLVAVLVLVMSMSGCIETEEKSIEEKYPSVIIGKALSVAEGSGNSSGVMAAVLEADSKYILARTEYQRHYKLAKAMALIQSEISDGDDEMVELRGHYSGQYEEKGKGIFIIHYAKANGLEVEF